VLGDVDDSERAAVRDLLVSRASKARYSCWQASSAAAPTTTRCVDQHSHIAAMRSTENEGQEVRHDVTILSCTSSSSSSSWSSFSSCSTLTRNQSINQSINGLDEGMIDKSCAILNQGLSLSLTNALLNMSLALSHQSLYQSQSTSLSNTKTKTKTKRR